MSDELLPPAPQPDEKPPKKRQRKPYTLEQLGDGYGVNSRGEDRYKIRYQRPEVAAHVARILLDHVMDYEAATTKILQASAKANGWEPPTDEAIIRHAKLLERSPQIQRALRQHLEKVGLGDDAQKRWVASMKMLGAAMQMDKKVDYDNKPQPLTLLGAGPLLERMGLKVNDNIEEEEDDARTNERSEPEETESDGLEDSEST